jgi:hypothetical protein
VISPTRRWLQPASVTDQCLCSWICLDPPLDLSDDEPQLQCMPHVVIGETRHSQILDAVPMVTQYPRWRSQVNAPYDGPDLSRCWALPARWISSTDPENQPDQQSTLKGGRRLYTTVRSPTFRSSRLVPCHNASWGQSSQSWIPCATARKRITSAMARQEKTPAVSSRPSESPSCLSPELPSGRRVQTLRMRPGTSASPAAASLSS